MPRMRLGEMLASPLFRGSRIPATGGDADKRTRCEGLRRNRVYADRRHILISRSNLMKSMTFRTSVAIFRNIEIEMDRLDPNFW